MPTYPTAPITSSPTKPKIDQNEGPQEEMVLNVPKRPKNLENGAGPGAAKFFV